MKDHGKVTVKRSTIATGQHLAAGKEFAVVELGPKDKLPKGAITLQDAKVLLRLGKVVPAGTPAPKVENQEPAVENQEPAVETQEPAVETQPGPVHVGGGIYELADGSRIKGKAAAFEAAGLKV